MYLGLDVADYFVCHADIMGVPAVCSIFAALEAGKNASRPFA